MTSDPANPQHNADMAVYRLVPAAEPGDATWGRAENYGEVVVRARSAGDARIVASDREIDFMDVGSKPGSGVSTRHASAFRDDKLYAVIEDTSGAFAKDGPRGILKGFSPGPIKASP